MKKSRACRRCGKRVRYLSSYEIECWHKCNYAFWRRMEEFGECVKG